MGRESKIRKMRKEGIIAPVKEEKKNNRWIKILVYVILILVTAFAVVRVWGYVDRDVAARVGSETIKKEEVQNQLEYYINMYKQYGLDLTSPKYSGYLTNLKKNVQESLINQSLLVQYAKAHHLKVDPDKLNKELNDQINQIIEKGKKDQGESTFNDYVEAQYGSMDAYKNFLKKKLTPYIERPLLAQAALNEQYKTIKITDDDIKKYWNSTYEVDAEHFLLEVDKNAPQKDVEKAKAEAENIYKEIMDEKKKEGSKFSFADFAKKKAAELNKKTAKSGKEVARYENLGYFAKGTMVKPFEDACFDPKVKVGDIIGPIKTDFGFHIIHILGKKPMSAKYDEPPKVDVRLILFKYKQGDKKSEDAAKMSANSIAIQTKRNMNFIEAVKKFSQDEATKKKDGETGFFTEKDHPALFNAAEKLKKGEIAGPIKTSEGYAVIQLIGKKPGVKASLDNKDIYKKVEDDLMNEKKQEVEKAFIEKLKKQYKVRTTDPWRSLTAFFDKHFGKQWNSFVTWWNGAISGKSTTEPTATTPSQLPSTISPPSQPGPSPSQGGGK